MKGDRMSVRRHLRTNLVGYIALFVALVGVPTAWAVAKNSVGSKQLKPGAVKTSDIANNAVKSPKVADGSLLAQDFASGQLPAGPPGAPGQPFRAMALVDGDPTSPSFLPDIPEVGFTSVSHNSTGVFCLVTDTGIDPTTDPPFLTVEYNFSAGENFTVMWDQGTGNCTDGEYEIHTYAADTAAPVDDVAFVVMVP
jgi:hypothetical protein